MRLRRVDANGDMTFGRSRRDFWNDEPDGVAQLVAARLHLGTDEWFLDHQEGTPWKTQVLGRRTESSRDMVLRLRMLNTRGVTSLASYNSQLDRSTRRFSVQASLNTLYGGAQIPTYGRVFVTDALGHPVTYGDALVTGS